MAGQGVPAMGYAAYMETPPVTRVYATGMYFSAYIRQGVRNCENFDSRPSNLKTVFFMKIKYLLFDRK